MPTKKGKDEKGCYYMWGNQEKYYFPCSDIKAANTAKKKADAQGIAIIRSGYKYKKKA